MSIRRFLHWCQYLTLLAMKSFFGNLPGRLSAGIGRICGGIGFWLFPYARQRAIHNIECSLGVGRSRARTLAGRGFQHLGEVWTENGFFWPRLRRDTFRDYVLRVDGEDHVAAAKAAGKGAIFVTGHIGNWEMGGMVTAFLWGELIAIANLGNNPLITDYMARFRERDGQRIVSRKGGMRPMLRHLRQGGAIGIVMDLDARRHGVIVPFFGRPASTTPTPARLALSTGAPIMAGALYRTGTLQHHYTVGPPIHHAQGDRDRETAVLEITAELNRALEDLIRPKPEQWPWSHPRWETGLRAQAGQQEDT